LNFFFRIHDPTTKNKQGNDSGTQYRSAIFYHDQEQLDIAKKVMDQIAADPAKMKQYSKNTIVTTLEAYTQFYIAESYHQRYLEDNRFGYCNHKKRW